MDVNEIGFSLDHICDTTESSGKLREFFENLDIHKNDYLLFEDIETMSDSNSETLRR